MSKIKLFIASSLDGYIARTNGSVDWLFTDHDYGYTKFFDSVGTVVMGRKTYEQVLTFGEYPYQDKQSIVLSHSNVGQCVPGVRFVAGDVSEIVAGLDRFSNQDIWLVGGAEVVRDFMAAQLVDEIILSLVPIVLGSGIPLFLSSQVEQSYVLVSSQSFGSGLVQLHYSKS